MTVKFKILIFIFLHLGALQLFVDSAYAHRVNVFAWVEGETIYVESKYSGGRVVKAGKIVVTDSRGIELLSGLTDDEGQYSFEVPQKSDLRIIVSAGQGHQGEWTVRETEFQGLVSKAPSNSGRSKIAISDQEKVSGNVKDNSGTATTGRGIESKELEAIIETVLDRKLQPVTRMLADMRQEGPAIGDIFAGIGYILGLVGIAAYIQNRKRKE